MRGIMLALAAVCGWLLCSAQESENDARFVRAVSLARQDATRLSEQIRGLLSEELARGGFTGAVIACSRTAQATTEKFAAETGRPIRRVSLKYRNPKDKPDGFETRKLKEFERLNRENRLPTEHVEIVRKSGREYVRYLKPIVIQPMCLKCHGPAETIPQQVAIVLHAQYPEDRATGHRAGDLRGVFSVTVALDKRK